MGRKWVGLGVGNLPGNSRNSKFSEKFLEFPERNGLDLLKFGEITEILKSLKTQYPEIQITGSTVISTCMCGCMSFVLK